MDGGRIACMLLMSDACIPLCGSIFPRTYLCFATPWPWRLALPPKIEIYWQLLEMKYVIISIACHSLVDIPVSQDTITGLLLAGIGQVTQDQRKNFFIVEPSTQSL